MLERWGLPVTDEDRAADAKEAERIARQFANRRSSWESRTDWGKASLTPEERRERTDQMRRRASMVDDDPADAKADEAQADGDGDREESN
jgi:hypothetical protein